MNVNVALPPPQSFAIRENNELKKCPHHINVNLVVRYTLLHVCVYCFYFLRELDNNNQVCPVMDCVNFLVYKIKGQLKKQHFI